MEIQGSLKPQVDGTINPVAYSTLVEDLKSYTSCRFPGARLLSAPLNWSITSKRGWRHLTEIQWSPLISSAMKNEGLGGFYLAPLQLVRMSGPTKNWNARGLSERFLLY